jgi:uncharacterized membrane protein YgdD (TMEM256/DUF423 family)
MITHEAITRRIIVCAGISGALGVVMGSFGAHGLETFLASGGLDQELVLKRLDQFDVAVRYHLIHSVALLALAALTVGSPSRRRWVSRLFVFGLFLFSGSLYALVLTNTPVLGAITPLGGLSWIAGWLLLPWLARAVSSE